MNISVMYKMYHRSCDFSTGSARVCSIRWMDCGRSVVFCDEYATGVYYVLDCCGAGARREITRKPPPQVSFFTKNKTITIFNIVQKNI